MALMQLLSKATARSTFAVRQVLASSSSPTAGCKVPAHLFPPIAAAFGRHMSDGAGPQKPKGIADLSKISIKPFPSSQSASWADVPSGCKTLGLAGVIPFIALCPPVAAAIPLMPIEVITNAPLLQTCYGVSIASFLGGVHWGMAMAEYGGRELSAKAAIERYFWSITPSLIAFPAVTLPPLGSSLVIAGTLGAAYVVDRSFTAKGLLPKWYMALRLPLTLGACSGMLMTAYYYTYLA